MAKKETLGNAVRYSRLSEVIDVQSARYLKVYGYFDATFRTACGRKEVTITIGPEGQIIDISERKDVLN